MSLGEILNWRKVVCFGFGILFLTSGLLINFLQVLLYFFLRPVSKYLFRKVNYYLNYSLFSQLVFLQQYWAGVKVRIYTREDNYDKYFGKEHAFLIMNHTYEIDWLLGWVLSDNCRVLGNCKAFAKKSLQYIPTLGYSWKLSGYIFLERNWEKDRKVFESKLQELSSYEDPIWLMLAAEGTRFTKEKHEASKIFAKEHGLPELRHHLTPRTKGFTTSVLYSKDRIPAIYNINVAIKPNGVEPTLNNLLLGKSIFADFYVDRFPTNQLPEGEEKLAAWLHNLYKDKDDLLHSYLSTGSWFEMTNFPKREGFFLQRRIYPALNVVFWSILIYMPLCYFVIKLFFSGNLIYCGTVVAIFGSLMHLFNKIVNETQISNASSYGVSKGSMT